MSDTKTVIHSTPWLGFLQIILIVLKVIGSQFPTPVAQWSWLVVLIPTWISLTVLIVSIGLIVIATIVAIKETK